MTAPIGTADAAWLDASAGVAGDMLLGALVGAGAPLEVVQRAVDAVVPGGVTLQVEQVRRAGLAATRCHVEEREQDPPTRHYADVRALVERAALPETVRSSALRVLRLLAEAEGRVHGVAPEQVHFHEVGALDSIADIVGVCAAVAHLGLPGWVSSPVSVGSGRVRGAHGSLPVPAPAVVELLRGVPSQAGPAEFELCTPTGAALLTAFATGYGAQPAMTVLGVGVGAGSREVETHANVVRLLVGCATAEAATTVEWVIEANVDDLDPRVWPHVLDALLRAGAADAWLTPILMKKGRPAHTLHVLCAADRRDAVREVVVTETTTIGFREHAVVKHALARETLVVEVDGEPIEVKVARHDGRVVNLQPEYDQVAALAARTGRPLAELLDRARARARAAADTPG